MSLDPKARDYVSYSDYVYVGDNPVMVIDPNGKEWGDFLDGLKDKAQDYVADKINQAAKALVRSVASYVDYKLEEIKEEMKEEANEQKEGGSSSRIGYKETEVDEGGDMFNVGSSDPEKNDVNVSDSPSSPFSEWFKKDNKYPIKNQKEPYSFGPNGEKRSDILDKDGDVKYKIFINSDGDTTARKDENNHDISAKEVTK